MSETFTERHRYIVSVSFVKETLKVCFEHYMHSTWAPFVTHTMSKQHSSSIHLVHTVFYVSPQEKTTGCDI